MTLWGLCPQHRTRAFGTGGCDATSAAAGSHLMSWSSSSLPLLSLHAVPPLVWLFLTLLVHPLQIMTVEYPKPKPGKAVKVPPPLNPPSSTTTGNRDRESFGLGGMDPWERTALL